MKITFWLPALIAGVSATSKHSSLNEPFQSEFKHLEHSPCVTLYHRNGRAGCGTVDREAQTGPLFYYDGSSNPPQGESFVAVIEEYNLSADTMDALINANQNTGNLKGVLVLNSTYANDENQYSSPGPTYPLGYGTPSADISYGNIQFPWNTNGDGLNHYDLYGIPVAYVNEQEASSYIRQSAISDDDSYKVSTTFNYYMGPDFITSKECLAWTDAADGNWNPKCLPLGGTSVWAFAGSPYQNANARKLEDAGDAEETEEDAGNEEEVEEENAADEEEADAENNQDANEEGSYGNANAKPAIIFAASMDSTSMFHDLAPGANEGASNILTILMAAYLLGKTVNDATLDSMNYRIIFALFDGEAYGYLGSRKFLNDIFTFQCNDQYTVNSVSKDADSDKACLYPMQPSLRFKDIGEIATMVTVDQIAVPSGQGNLYVHNEGEGEAGTYMANLLKYSKTNDYTAVDSAAVNQGDGGDFPYPPSPLTALQALTGGGIPGVVLTGYDYAFTKRPPYQSHLNFVYNMDMDYKAIASAATMLARSAYAAGFDDGSYDFQNDASAAANAIGELSYNDNVLVELADCLFLNGNCKMLNKYANMEAWNERSRTGFDVAEGESLGNPPNYYVGVHRYDYGQPFVRVGDKVYGAYDGEEYGQKGSDAIGMQPRMLQQAIRNMFSDFLGRGSSENGNTRSCRKPADCQGIDYCNGEGDVALCSGAKRCVCQRAFYHVALDEAVEPAVNKATGYFVVSEDDNQISPMWTEPYWSNNVGVKMYRVAKTKPGFVSLAAGAIAVGVCFFLAVIVKVEMRKEKVY